MVESSPAASASPCERARPVPLCASGPSRLHLSFRACGRAAAGAVAIRGEASSSKAAGDRPPPGGRDGLGDRSYRKRRRLRQAAKAGRIRGEWAPILRPSRRGARPRSRRRLDQSRVTATGRPRPRTGATELRREGKPGSAGTDGRPARLAFGFHQGLEYLAGLYLVGNAAHLRETGAVVCFVAGVAMVVLAALTHGPLGIGPRPPATHRMADLVLVPTLAAAPVLFHFGHDLAAVLLVEPLAAAMVVMVKVTNYTRPQPRGRRCERPGAPAASRAVISEETIRAGARVAGIMAGKVKEQGPRVAGQLVGRHLAKRRRPPPAS